MTGNSMLKWYKKKFAQERTVQKSLFGTKYAQHSPSSLTDLLAAHKDSAHLKAVLELLAEVEEKINSPGELFACLDVAFLPVGSAIEGTRIHSTNESDCMVFFR